MVLGPGTLGTWPHQDGGSPSLGMAFAKLAASLCFSTFFVLSPACFSPGSLPLRAPDSTWVTRRFLSVSISLCLWYSVSWSCPCASSLAHSALTRGSQARTWQAPARPACPQPRPAPTPSCALFPPPRRPAPPAGSPFPFVCFGLSHFIPRLFPRCPTRAVGPRRAS